MDYSLQPVPHVNLMMDTFIANSNVEDLRAVVRALLVSGPPNTSSAFQKVVKQRLTRNRLADKSPLPHPSSLYAPYLLHPYSSSSSASSSTSLPVSEGCFSSAASAPSSPASSTAGSPRLSSTSDLASSIPDADPIFSPQAHDLLTRARALFGAGLGLESLPLLTVLIRGTSTLRWSEDGGFVDSLAVLDGDISQAIQSATEEITQQVLALQLSSSSPSVVGPLAASEGAWVAEGYRALSDLRAALKSCESEVVSWGGEFPFERGMLNVDWLEQSDLWIKNMVVVA